MNLFLEKRTQMPKCVYSVSADTDSWVYYLELIC